MKPQLIMDVRDFEKKFTDGWNPNAQMTTDDMASSVFGAESVMKRKANMAEQQMVNDATGMTEAERRAKGIFTTSDTSRVDTSPEALNATDIPPEDLGGDVQVGPRARQTLQDTLPAPISFLGNLTVDTVGGGVDAVQSMGRLVTSVRDSAYELMPVIKEIDTALGLKTEGPSRIEQLTSLLPELPKDDSTVTGQFVRPAAQWATGFIPVFAALRPLAVAGAATNANLLATGALASMLSSVASFDGAEANLFDIVKGTPLESIVPEFLEKQETDSDLEMRLKNGIADLGLSGAMAGFGKLFFESIRGLKHVRKIVKDGRQLADEAGVSTEELAKQIDNGAITETNGTLNFDIQRQFERAPRDKNPEATMKLGKESTPKTKESTAGKAEVSKDLVEQAAKAEQAIPEPKQPGRDFKAAKPTDLRGGGDKLVESVGKTAKAAAEGFKAPKGDRIIGSVIQWKNYTSDDELAGLIDQVTSGIKKKSISDDAIQAAAKSRGISLKEIQELGGETEDIALRGIATAVLEQKHAKDVLMPLAREVSLNPTKENMLEFVNQAALNRNLSRAYQRFASGAGRALRAVQKMRDFTDNIGEDLNMDTISRLRNMANDPDTYRNIEALAQKLGALENPAQANQFLRDVLRTPWDKMWDSTYYYYINSLLSSPVTHAVNIAGTSGMMAYRVAEHELAAVLGAGRRLVTGGSLDGPAVGEMIYGQAMATRDVWRLISKSAQQRSSQPFIDAVSKGKSLMSRDASKVDLIRHNPISAANYFGDDAGGYGWKAKAVDGIGKVVGAPTGFLQVTDDLMKIYAYRSKQYSEAYRQALMDGFDPSKDMKAFGGEVNRWMKDPLPDMSLREANIREDVAKVAERFAYESTFTEELGNDVVSRMGKSMDVVAKNIPGGRYVLPFVRTPTNLLRQGLLERTPMALMHSQMRKDFLAGGAKRDMVLAKVGMGTMAMQTVWGYAGEGRITGGGPKDPKLRQQLENAGWKPYSVKIGDTWYEYKRLDPLGYIVGAAADLYELTHMADSYENEPVEGNETFLDKIGQVSDAIAMSFVRNITSRVYTQSLADFFTLITGESDGGALEPVQNILSGFSPNLLAFFKQNVEGDTTVEDTRPDPMDSRMMQFFDQTLNKMKAKIPGYDAGPALTNPLGEELMRDPRFAFGIVPAANKPAEFDPVFSEAWRVRADIRNPDRTIYANGLSTKLTPEEYSQLKKNIANEKFFDGMTTRQYLEKMIKGSVKFQTPAGPINFQEAPEEDNGAMEVYTKREIIESIYNQAKKMAADKLLYDDYNGSGDIMRRLQKQADKQRYLDTTPRQMPNLNQGSGGVPQVNFEVQ